MMEQLSLFSIGHSNHPLERYFELLRLHGVEVVADVRSAPYSRYSPHFNARNLQNSLAAVGIRYVYLGRELGGRPEEDEFYDEEGHVLYGQVAESELFARGIARLNDEAARSRVAMMCSEEDPSGCHRHLLVARVLASKEIAVLHIRGDGRLETSGELTRRQEKPRQQLLFDDAKEETWRSIRSVSPRRPPRSSSAS